MAVARSGRISDAACSCCVICVDSCSSQKSNETSFRSKNAAAVVELLQAVIDVMASVNSVPLPPHCPPQRTKCPSPPHFDTHDKRKLRAEVTQLLSTAMLTLHAIRAHGGAAPGALASSFDLDCSHVVLAAELALGIQIRPTALAAAVADAAAACAPMCCGICGPSLPVAAACVERLHVPLSALADPSTAARLSHSSNVLVVIA